MYWFVVEINMPQLPYPFSTLLNMLQRDWPGWGNGYVGIPPGHPCYMLDMYKIQQLFKINIHGGLTFAGFQPWNGHLVPKEYVNHWFVGFDTMHGGDTKTVWTKERVEAETRRLAEQMEAITAPAFVFN